MKKVWLIAALFLIGLINNSKAYVVAFECSTECRTAAETARTSKIPLLLNKELDKQWKACQDCLLKNKEDHKWKKGIDDRKISENGGTIYNGACKQCNKSCFADKWKGTSCAHCVTDKCYTDGEIKNLMQDKLKNKKPH